MTFFSALRSAVLCAGMLVSGLTGLVCAQDRIPGGIGEQGLKESSEYLKKKPLPEEKQEPAPKKDDDLSEIIKKTIGTDYSKKTTVIIPSDISQFALVDFYREFIFLPGSTTSVYDQSSSLHIGLHSKLADITSVNTFNIDTGILHYIGRKDTKTLFDSEYSIEKTDFFVSGAVWTKLFGDGREKSSGETKWKHGLFGGPHILYQFINAGRGEPFLYSNRLEAGLEGIAKAGTDQVYVKSLFVWQDRRLIRESLGKYTRQRQIGVGLDLGGHFNAVLGKNEFIFFNLFFHGRLNDETLHPGDHTNIISPTYYRGTYFESKYDLDVGLGFKINRDLILVVGPEARIEYTFDSNSKFYEKAAPKGILNAKAGVRFLIRFSSISFSLSTGINYMEFSYTDRPKDCLASGYISINAKP